MADKIPEYFARERMETSRLPRAPARQLADVGAGLEAEAMAGFGEVLSAVIQKWYEREGNTQFDTQRRLVREEINKFELTGFATADEHDAAYKKLKATIKRLAPKNRMGARKFQSWRDSISPIMDRSAAEKKIRQIHQNNQVEYFKNISGIITEKDFDKAKAEAKLLTQGAVDDKTRTPAQAASDYQRIMADWDEARKQALLETVAEAARTMPLKDALYYLNVIPRTDITETERNGLIAQRERQEKIGLEEDQKETGRQMLVRFWDGKLTDVNEITRALDANLITETKAKALRNAILNPEPPKTDLKAYVRVKEAINDIGRGTVNIDQALEVIYENLDKLDPTTGKSLVDKIFGEHDKNDSEMFKEGRDLMEELIRDKDPISGMFTDDERQILGTAEAIIMLDAAIEKAAKEDKPLKRTELLIEAIKIGRIIKQRVKKEEKEKIEPAFGFEISREKAKVLTEAEVRALLNEAGGDVQKARELAKQRGWVIPK